MLLRQGRLSKWFSGHRPGGDRHRCRRGARAERLRAADAPQPRRLHGPRARAAAPASASCSGARAASRRAATAPSTSARSSTGIVGMISHLGAMLPVACGLALAAQLRGETPRGGGLHRRRRDERGRLPRGAQPGGGLEAAGALRDREQPVGPLDPGPRAVRVPPPGRPRHRLRHARRASWTATTCSAVVRAVRRAAERGRRGDGPTLLEFKTFRMRGHEEASGIDYVPKQELEEWAKKDPVARYESLPRRAAACCGGPTSRASARRCKARDRRARGRGARGPRAESPAARPELGDVYAPSAARALRPPPRRRGRARAPLRRRDQRRPARSRCAATSASCCWARTSPSTAASSR